MTIEEIANIAHEINKAYCESIDDFSQPSWENILPWQKTSLITGIKFLLSHPNAEPEAVHETWLTTKQRDGWKYGPKKDPKKKEHPCMVPFKDLPKKHKTKDFLFKAVVDTLSKIENIK